MKQVLQNLSTGETQLTELPCPSINPGEVLIRTTKSLISPGTERMLVDFSKSNLLDKARQQPEKVRQVLDKVKTDGLMPTLEAVKSKLDTPLPLGYCNVGRVLKVGSQVKGLKAGDRVISNGTHAEVVKVPQNLCCKVPDNVSDEEAAFTVLASIALQGVRLLQPTLGEAFVVMGLGLIGQLTIQILKAHSCKVLGVDFDEAKCEMARSWGSEAINPSQGADVESAAREFSKGRGVDGVLLTLASKSDEPMHQAAQICRKKGRIILVGVTGLNLLRSDFFEKELQFQVSCSYGPGRYDGKYEQEGQDYPLPYVRWTEQRNFEAILDMLDDSRLQVQDLISHRFSFSEAGKAYNLLSEGGSSLGILLDYPEEIPDSDLLQPVVHWNQNSPAGEKALSVSFLGGGNYASRVLVPAFKKTNSFLKGMVSTGSPNSVYQAQKHFSEASTDPESLFSDNAVKALVVATQHDSHAELALKGLAAGKHLFVEKPLAINEQQLSKLESQYRLIHQKGPGPLLMVGFNRRFSPLTQKMKSLLEPMTSSKVMVMTVNAGEIPGDHWTQHPQFGGGRIIGEGCHFIDLLRHLAGSPISEVQCLGTGPLGDIASINLKFSNGDLATLHYLANGAKNFPKERLEVFTAGRTLQLDNFRALYGFKWPGFSKMKLSRQDKGQNQCVEAFVRAVQQGLPSPIPFEEILEVTRATFSVAEKLREA